MTIDEAPTDDFVRQITDAFAQMPVSKAPTLREARDLIRPAVTGAAVVDDRRRTAVGRHVAFSHRILAISGVGLSSAAALLILLLALNSGGHLSAMERMTRELREIKSYSYNILSTAEFVDEKSGHPIVVIETGANYWVAPSAFRDERRIVRIDRSLPEKDRTEELLVEFVDLNPAETLGIFVDLKHKTFVHTPELGESATGSVMYPMDVVRLIRENSGKIVRELGSKKIEGRAARGYVIALRGARDGRKIEPQDVWVDAETDLPLEFGSETDSGGTKSVTRFSDFRWNIELDPKLFEASPPADCIDVTPPRGEAIVGQIVNAFRLYKQLCGKYPPIDSRVGTFDAAAIRDEMLQRTGFVGPVDPAWKDDPKYRQINSAGHAFHEVARVVRNYFHAGYDGVHVGLADKEKVLLWWRRTGPDGFRVFYGDLRTRIISDAEGEAMGLNGWRTP